MRPPGYPLVLAAAQILVPEDLQNGLMAAHSILFCICLFLFSTLISKQLSPWLAGLIVAPSTLRMLDFFHSNTGEWTVFCLLLVLIGSVGTISAPSPRRIHFLILGTCVAALALTKPVYVFLIPLGLLWILLSTHRKAALYFCAGLLPLVAWVAINKYRIDSYSLGLQGGYAFFHASSLLGDAPVSDTDSHQLRSCILFLNANRAKVPDEFIARAGDFFGPGIPNNQGAMALKLSSELSLNWPEIDGCMKTYSLRSIRAHFLHYVQHLSAGALIFRYSLIEFLLIGVLIWQVKAPWSQFMRSIGTAALLIHFSHISVIIMSQVVLPRYYIMTAQLLWIAICAGIACRILNLVEEAEVGKVAPSQGSPPQRKGS